LNKVAYWPNNQWRGINLRTPLYPDYKALPDLMKTKFYELVWDYPMKVLFRLKMWFPLWTASILVNAEYEDYFETYDEGFDWEKGLGAGEDTVVPMDNMPALYGEKTH